MRIGNFTRSVVRRRAKSSVNKKGEKKLVCHVGSSREAVKPPGGRMTPALFTSNRSPGSPTLRKSCTSSVKLCTESKSKSSKCTTLTRPSTPSGNNLAANFISRQPNNNDTAGCLLNWLANSKPMPLVAPVMTILASSPAHSANNWCKRPRATATRAKRLTVSTQQPPTAVAPATTHALPINPSPAKAAVATAVESCPAPTSGGMASGGTGPTDDEASHTLGQT
mmetsp:Transcript_55510/g.180043  ORF Transcript_55510/g.180043 Transcript_55510/m.180043 type:complete len:224 (+) Transcript_55510:613-1284(+)